MNGKIVQIITILFVMLSLSFACSPKPDSSKKISGDTDTTQNNGNNADTNTSSSPDTGTTEVPTVKKLVLFVGTYTSGTASKGIYVYEFDPDSGSLSYISSVNGVENPSFLVVHPNKRWLFSVGETGNPNGQVAAYSYDSTTKKLTFLNAVSSMGSAPCYISVDQSGKYAFAANYNSGSVGVFPISADGTLESYSFLDQHTGSGPNASRQAGPHAHMVITSPDNRFVYSTDLGTDQVIVRKLDVTSGKLDTTDHTVNVTPGAGPRHMAFNAAHTRMYVICELGGIIEAFNIDTVSGSLSHFQTISTLPAGSSLTPGSAEILLSPSGKYLYASNRGDVNNIAIFSVDPSTGKLTSIGFQSVLGKTPRSFVIDPAGKFLLVANQDSGTVITFRINQDTGLLEDTGIVTKIPAPVCLEFYEK